MTTRPQEPPYRVSRALVGRAVCHRTLVQLALEIGCRLQSELVHLPWTDLDLNGATLTIRATHSKNSRRRTVLLSPGMVATVRAPGGRHGEPARLPGPHGGLLHGLKQHYFAVVCSPGLVGVNVHCLRHSWGSGMVASGCDLVLLKELGGWHSLTMGSRYSHGTVARGVEAVARMLAARAAAQALRSCRRSFPLELPPRHIAGSREPREPTRENPPPGRYT